MPFLLLLSCHSSSVSPSFPELPPNRLHVPTNRAMPRENSFSDSDGRSLTPDIEEAFASSPVYDGTTAERIPEIRSSFDQSKARSAPAGIELTHINGGGSKQDVTSPTSLRSHHSHPAHAVHRPTFSTPKERFQATVRKVMAMRRTSSLMVRSGIGAEPGVDPRRASAYVNYGHIRQKCLIEVNDYSTMRTSFGRMTNTEFIRLLSDPQASHREPWVKVRWINIGGISWDIISALAMKYGAFSFSPRAISALPWTARLISVPTR